MCSSDLYYWITADSEFCPGDSQSESVSGWAMTDLAVVTGVVASQGDQCFDLLVTWDPVENIIQYEIYRNVTGVTPILGDDLPINTTTSAIFLDDTADVGIEYYYWVDRKSTRLNSSHVVISYAVFCLKKKKYYFFFIF